MHTFPTVTGLNLSHCCSSLYSLVSDVGTIMFWYGPMNGTEDTLGMTEGWAIDENNGVYWPECNNGTYENFMYLSLIHISAKLLNIFH